MFAKSFEILGFIEFLLGQNTISNVKSATLGIFQQPAVQFSW